MVVVQLRQNNTGVSGGFYTLREAARLLRVEHVNCLHTWLKNPRSGVGPIIKRQYEPTSKVHDVGFLDLMQMRFIVHFRRQGISLQSLRKAAENARVELQQEYPFATSDKKFMTDRKEVFLHTAKEEKDDFLLNLMTNQIAMYEAFEQVLSKGVTFSPQSGTATMWQPMPSDYPNIIVDPLRACGQPVIAPHFVPTKAILSLWIAESGDYRAVADWFEISRDGAEEAVKFEVSLAA